MNKTSHKERVLEALRVKSVSPYYAINYLGNTRLAATIFDLKKDGHEISSVIDTGLNKFGDKVSFSRYTLVKENINA